MARSRRKQLGGPRMARQAWQGNPSGPCGPNGQALADSPKYLAAKLDDGYRNSWERRVIMKALPVNERKRAPVPVQNWEAKAQERRYAIT